MPCYKPLAAWRSSELTANGKNKIVFANSGPHSYTEIKLPCGRCIGCKLDRSLMWAIRSIQEAQCHNQNSFITLTYSPELLPWDGSLTKSHFQKFMKRLRKHFKTQTIRYYMCGEYGTNLQRPHYHACLFGLDFPDKELFREDEGLLLFTSEILETIWGKGFVTVSEMSFETAAYAARYIAKKITGDQAEDHYQTTCPTTGKLIHLEPEYNAMSRRPGLAVEWYKKYKSDIYPSDFLIYKNKKIKVPRYYDNLYEADDGDIETIKLLRKKRARLNSKDSTPERLAVREKVKQLNYKQLQRNYENEA